MNNKGLLLVLSGPSGVGKGSICRELLRQFPEEYALSISVTSRPPRSNELDGREYFFRTREQFEQMIEEDMLLEHACYAGNDYGTPRTWVEEKLEQGVNVILEIDYQGGFQVREKFPRTLMIFVMPPDKDALVFRLKKRGTETQEQIRIRLEKAEEEMQYAQEYDYVIVNEVVEKSVEMLHNIVLYEKDTK